MEPNDTIESGYKIPVIFGLITTYQLHEILENNGAKHRETKALFLIRDSSTYPGLATISYYSQEEDTVKNIRFGLTAEGWKMAPKPPKEPKITDTFEVKEKYKHDKEKFDNDMKNFVSTAKTLFEQNATPEQIKSLGAELQQDEFSLEGLIKPNRIQASKEKHYAGYISNAFVADERPNQDRSSSMN